MDCEYRLPRARFSAYCSAEQCQFQTLTQKCAFYREALRLVGARNGMGGLRIRLVPSMDDLRDGTE